MIEDYGCKRLYEEIENHKNLTFLNFLIQAHIWKGMHYLKEP